MPAESFHLVYSGDGIHAGAMDVYELAPALTAMGNLIRDTDRIINGNQTSVDIRVSSEFTKGSFDVHLLITQHVLESAHQSLEFASVINASGLLRTLFGMAKDHTDTVAEVAVAGLLTIYKFLKGEKPRPGNTTIENNYGTIINGDVKIKVDARAAQIYNNDAIRADLDHVARSVATQGIDKLEVRQGARLLDDLKKVDLPTRVISYGSTQPNDARSLTNSREALVKVITANFEDGKWKFSDGSSKFNATIADPTFLQKLDSREEGFYKGDVLRVLNQDRPD